MGNSKNNIVVIGGRRAQSAYSSLSKKYEHVYYFKDETVYSSSINLLPEILIIEESEKSISILKQLKFNAHVNVIYLSNNKGFGHAFSMVRKGVVDYILKDSFLNYSIQQSVRRAFELPKSSSDSMSKRLFIDSSALNKRFPLRFKLVKFLFF